MIAIKEKPFRLRHAGDYTNVRTGKNETIKTTQMTGISQEQNKKTGILLVNLGSPTSPKIRDVGKWLKEFLMDGYVLDMPWPIRKLLVSGVILPTRLRQTTAAYQSIWTEQGSPLIVNSIHLTRAVSEQTDATVAYAMRYGQPGIREGMQSMLDQGVQKLLIAPLYPQYARATTETVLQQARAINRQLSAPMELKSLPPFYQNAAYIECLVASLKNRLKENDHLLFSYHGLPERHIRKTDDSGQHCLAREDCCEQQAPAHATCYLHQAKVTSRLVVQQLGLPPSRWHLSFQSRLGRVPWLRPYTEEVLRELPKQGVRQLVVVCPAFVADNLETLEEIDIRGKETFLAAGGKSWLYVPCLNDVPEWSVALTNMCLQALNEPGAEAEPV